MDQITGRTSGAPGSYKWIFLQTDYPSGDLSFLVLRKLGIARKIWPPSREVAQTVACQFRRDVRLGGSAHANLNASSRYHSINGQIKICKTEELNLINANKHQYSINQQAYSVIPSSCKA